jgi:hypothetical protein
MLIFMQPAVERIVDQALGVPFELRSQLIERLAESIVDSQCDELKTAWAVEAIRRRNEVRSGGVRPIPGNQ